MRTLSLALLFIVVLCSNRLQASDIDQKLSSADQQFFVENKGQWPSEVLFQTRMQGLDAWITRSGVVYDFFELEKTKSTGLPPHPTEASQPLKTGRIGHVVKLALENASARPQAEGASRSKAYYNFLLGSDPSKWATQVGLYKDAWVKGAYAGIDVHYYFEGSAIRYDYVLHPGADAGLIAMHLEGQNRASVNAKGELEFQTRFGTVTQAKLFAYQQVDGQKRPVNCRFIMDKEGRVQFEVGNYDHSQELVIDPLVYSSFYGAGSYTDNYAYGMAVDASGNAYVTGYTTSTYGFPTTSGAYQSSGGGGSYDVFVTKLNASGSALAYSTYLGGGGYDVGISIAVDASNNAYITGYTSSSFFPTTTSAYSRTLNGSYNCFVTKLNASGSGLLYSTYLGGNSTDVGLGMTIDGSGNAYVTGYTYSTSFPTTVNAYDRTYNSGEDVFVTKLNSTGSSLLYSTFIGGSGDEGAQEITLDGSLNAYITGSSNSVAYPVTSGAYATSLAGNTDAIVTKLNATGTALIYSTYLGGTGTDYGGGIAIDASGNAYVAGSTSSSNFPTTSGTFAPVYGGTQDMFVTKLNASGTALGYSTFAGGSDADNANKLKLDASGNAYIVGKTSSYNSPTIAGAYSTTLNGSSDVYLLKLSPTGTGLYASYFGGSGAEEAFCEALDNSGNLYLAGYTNTSYGFPTTPGAYTSYYYGYTTCFTSKFSFVPCTPFTVTATTPTPTACSGANVSFAGTPSNATSYYWTGPDYFYSSVQNPTLYSASYYYSSGTYKLVVTDASGCKDSASVNLTVEQRPSAYAYNNSPVCNGATVNLYSSSSYANDYLWSGPNGFSSSNANPTIPNATSASTGSYKLVVASASGMCKDSDYTYVSVRAPLNPTASSNSPVCAGANVQLSTSYYYNIYWSGPNNYYSSSQNPVIYNAGTSASGQYKVYVSDGYCSDSAAVTVVVNPRPTANASSNSPICAGADLNFTGNPSGLSNYTWRGPNSYFTTVQSPTITSATASQSGNYTLVVTNSSGCKDSSTINVFVANKPIASAIASPTAPCEGYDVTLNGGPSGNNYNWSGPGGFSSNSQSPVLYGATAGMSGRYFLTVVNSTGCLDTTSLLLNLLPSPAAPVVTDPTYCLHAVAAPLQAIGNNLQWYAYPAGGTGTSQPTPSTSAVGTTSYYVSQKVSGCESQRTLQTVTVLPLPALSSSYNGPVCVGDKLMLLGGYSGGGTYSWTGPNGFTSNDQNPVLDSATTDHIGVYTFKATESGCNNTASVLVAVRALPSVTATSNSNLAKGATIRLKGKPDNMASYHWTGPNNFVSNQQNPVLANSTPDMAGIYTLNVTDPGGCKNSDTAQVLLATGVVDITLSDGIRLYPNPARDYAILEMSEANSVSRLVQLFDATGKMVQSLRWQAGTASLRINTEMLASGSYLVAIEGGNGNAVKKLTVGR